jgi:hypothetical protein
MGNSLYYLGRAGGGIVIRERLMENSGQGYLTG